ncbi:MAG: hypothetical protein RMM53_08480, partial [Bacteroidia bacterium]|nr:hypothetical protein [Bacteroidia bacterium]
IVSYDVTGKPVTDPEYNPYPSSIFVYNNKFAQNRGLKADESRVLGQAVSLLRKQERMYPDVVYDGMVNTALLVEGKLPPEKRIC